MKENWINDMKRKLEGHQMDPPEGLWEGISERMGFKEALTPQPSSYVWLRWAAAAAVLALAGFFVFHDSNDVESQQANAVIQQPVIQEPQTEKPLLTHALPTPHHHKVSAVSGLAEEPLPSVVESQTEEISADSESPAVDTPSEAQQTPNEPQPKKSSEIINNHPAPHYGTVPKQKSHSANWSLGLNASGGLLAVNNVRTVRLYQAMNKNASIGGLAQYQEQNKGTESEHEYTEAGYYTLAEFQSKHHLPVRFGISVHYQLNDFLSLHSGINYTYLYSEFSIPLYPNIHYDQKLHYLGVPLGVTWQVWSANRFRFYLSGGMMLEKCVSNNMKEGAIEAKKPWQYSVEAAAGAEYTFTRQLGIYLEPSLGYYFDDGTSLEHYYKEHPLAPSIEFGLRLHLNK